MALKENQGNFYRDVVEYFDDFKISELKKSKINYRKVVETRGSETIIYEYFQTTNVDWYFEKKLWASLKSISFVKKTFDNRYNKQKETEIRYYISSLGLDILLFSTAIRMHWSVEYYMDT